MRKFSAAIFLVLSGLCSIRSFAAEPAPISSEAEAAVETFRAPVMLDGEILFSVRGTSSYPAPQRAQGISQRIQAVAADKTFDPASIQEVETPQFVALQAGDILLLRVLDADAVLDHVPRSVQSHLFRQKIVEAVKAYRHRRTPSVLLRNSLLAVAVTLLALIAIFVLRRVFRRLEQILDRRFKARLESLQLQSHQIIQAKPLQVGMQGAIGTARFIGFGTVIFVWLYLTLGGFPWTRTISLRLFPILLDPLQQMANGFIQALPNIAFLLILVLVIRYLLKLIRLYFSGLARGTIQLENFDPDWAWPTYKIVRLMIVSFSAVIAYPYIPGSNSEAFKGVSLFLGVVFSLGSSSVIANMIAGYSLTYRRAFKLGDVIKVRDVRGSVVDTGLMVTRVRTPKNEIIVVPNSTILNNEVMNYSAMARTGELILHTDVGIGYEVSWRQVEAMLLRAADRTPGVLKQPQPYVFLKQLADFAVVYEINCYCNEAGRMFQIYTKLHQNILDDFNEYGVQIMTPAYESDPETAKVVPKDQWYAAPAAKNSNKEQTTS